MNREGVPPRIEAPHKPVIRFAIPIFATDPRNADGIIISNVNTGRFTENLYGEKDGSTVALAGQEGYYIFHSSNKNKEWGAPDDLNTKENMYADFPVIKRENAKEKPSRILDSVDDIIIFSILAGFFISYRLQPKPSG